MDKNLVNIKMVSLYIKQHLATFEAQFMKMLSNTEAELKKSVAYEKNVCDSFLSPICVAACLT